MTTTKKNKKYDVYTLNLNYFCDKITFNSSNNFKFIFDCRRDSFITHRAFCDVLSQESASISAVNPLFSSHSQFHQSHGFQPLSLKKEQDFNLRPEIPLWLLPTHLNHFQNPNPTTLFPNNSFNSNNITTASPHMSATALLQKASQIGVTTVSKTEPCRPHLMQTHVPSGMVMPSREEIGTTGFSHCLASYGNKAAITSDFFEESSSLLHDVMYGSESSHSQFEAVTAAMNMRGMFDTQRDNNNFEEQYSHFGKSNIIKSGGANDDEMTRDFLSLGAFSQRDLFNISGIDGPLSLHGKQNQIQNQTPW